MLDPVFRRKFKLPLHFISFAIVQGKMYKSFKNKGTIVARNEVTKNRYNTVVYGAVYLCNSFDLFSKSIDAYHVCSKSNLTVNHKFDLNHRTEEEVTFIEFDSLEQLARLMYREKKTIKVQTYYANTNNPKILSRITSGQQQFRIRDGISIIPFQKQFAEVKNANSKGESPSTGKT